MEAGLGERITEGRMAHLLPVSGLHAELPELPVADRQRQRIDGRLQEIRILGAAQHGPSAAFDVHDQLSVDHDDQRAGLPPWTVTTAVSLGPWERCAVRVCRVGSRK